MFEEKKEGNIDKTVVNELLDPNKEQKEFIKHKKNDLFERKSDKLLTSDGRELFNEESK